MERGLTSEEEAIGKYPFDKIGGQKTVSLELNLGRHKSTKSHEGGWKGNMHRADMGKKATGRHTCFPEAGIGYAEV